MKIKFELKTFLLKLFLIIGLIAVDLITKELFFRFLGEGKQVDIIANVFSLQYTQNTGAAYGIFSNSTTMLIIVSCLFIVILAIYDLFNSSKNIWYNLGLSFIIGGAIGNLVDRIFLGYVRDFANFEIFKFIFNLADAFITFGLIFFVIYILKTLREEKVQNKSKVHEKISSDDKKIESKNNTDDKDVDNDNI